MIYACNDLVLETLVKMARGSYQKGLAWGIYRISGSDTRSKWGAGYARSRRAYLDRITDSETLVCEEREVERRRVLIVGSSEAEVSSVTDHEILARWS